jgi:hypothetical protein
MKSSASPAATTCRAISSCAVKRLVRSPEEWAWWHFELAYSLQQNPKGERADNLEQATHHYKQAVITRQAYPEDWATIQNHLAAKNLFKARDSSRSDK